MRFAQSKEKSTDPCRASVERQWQGKNSPVGRNPEQTRLLTRWVEKEIETGQMRQSDKPARGSHSGNMYEDL